MSDLIIAAQSAIERSEQLEKEIIQLRNNLDQVKHERDHLLGRVAELDRLYHEARTDSDHNLRWSTEVTRQLYNVGNFVNEAIELAREEMKKANPIHTNGQYPTEGAAVEQTQGGTMTGRMPGQIAQGFTRDHIG